MGAGDHLTSVGKLNKLVIVLGVHVDVARDFNDSWQIIINDHVFFVDEYVTLNELAASYLEQYRRNPDEMHVKWGVSKDKKTVQLDEDGNIVEETPKPCPYVLKTVTEPVVVESPTPAPDESAPEDTTPTELSAPVEETPAVVAAPVEDVSFEYIISSGKYTTTLSDVKQTRSYKQLYALCCALGVASKLKMLVTNDGFKVTVGQLSIENDLICFGRSTTPMEACLQSLLTYYRYSPSSFVTKSGSTVKELIFMNSDGDLDPMPTNPVPSSPASAPAPFKFAFGAPAPAPEKKLRQIIFNSQKCKLKSSSPHFNGMDCSTMMNAKEIIPAEGDSEHLFYLREFTKLLVESETDHTTLHLLFICVNGIPQIITDSLKLLREKRRIYGSVAQSATEFIHYAEIAGMYELSKQ